MFAAAAIGCGSGALVPSSHPRRSHEQLRPHVEHSLQQPQLLQQHPYSLPAARRRRQQYQVKQCNALGGAAAVLCSAHAAGDDATPPLPPPPSYRPHAPQGLTPASATTPTSAATQRAAAARQLAEAVTHISEARAVAPAGAAGAAPLAAARRPSATAGRPSAAAPVQQGPVRSPVRPVQSLRALSTPAATAAAEVLQAVPVTAGQEASAADQPSAAAAGAEASSAAAASSHTSNGVLLQRFETELLFQMPPPAQKRLQQQQQHNYQWRQQQRPSEGGSGGASDSVGGAAKSRSKPQRSAHTSPRSAGRSHGASRDRRAHENIFSMRTARGVRTVNSAAPVAGVAAAGAAAQAVIGVSGRRRGDGLASHEVWQSRRWAAEDSVEVSAQEDDAQVDSSDLPRRRQRRIGKEQPERPWQWGMSERALQTFSRLTKLDDPKLVAQKLREEAAAVSADVVGKQSGRAQSLRLGGDGGIWNGVQSEAQREVFGREEAGDGVSRSDGVGGSMGLEERGCAEVDGKTDNHRHGGAENAPDVHKCERLQSSERTTADAEGGGEARAVFSEGDILGFMKGFGKDGRWQHALAVFEWARNHRPPQPTGEASEPTGPSTAAVSLMLRILSRSDRIAEAEALFHLLLKNGFNFDVYAFTAMISTLSQSGRYAKAIALFEKMKGEGITPTLVTYNVVLGAYGRSGGSFHRMVQLVQELRAAGLSPDCYTYNTMISACAAGGQVDEAERLFAEMQRAVAPATVAVSQILGGRSGAGEGEREWVVDRWERSDGKVSSAGKGEQGGAGSKGGVVSVSRKSNNNHRNGRASDGQYSGDRDNDKNDGHADGTGGSSEGYEVPFLGAVQLSVPGSVSPTAVTFNALLDVYGKAKELHKAKVLLREMERRGFKPNRVTYNELIAAAAQTGEWEEAEGFLLTMEGEAGLTPDVFSFTALLNAYGRAGRVERIPGVMERMAACGCAPNLYTFNTLLDAYGRIGMLTQMEVVARQMESAGCTADIVTWNTMLRSYGWAKNAQGISSVMDRLSQSSCKPNRRTYNTLIDAYGALGSSAGAFAAYRAMMAAGLTPNSITYGSLLAALAREGRCREAEEVAVEMRAQGMRLDAMAQSSLLHAYANAGEEALLQQALQRLRATGQLMVHARGESGGAVLQRAALLASCRCGLVEEAEAAADALEATGNASLLDTQAFNAMLALHGRHGRLEHVARMLQRMRWHGAPADVVTYNTLIGAYGRCGRSSEAAALLEEMRSAGLTPSTISYNGVLLAFCKSGEVESALRFLREMDRQPCAQPDASSCHIVGGALFRVRHFADAAAVFERCQQRCVRLSIGCYEMWVDSLCQLGQLKTAADVARSASECGDAALSASLLRRVEGRSSWAKAAAVAVAAEPWDEALR